MLTTLLSTVVIAFAAAGPEPTGDTPLLTGPTVSTTNVTGDSSTFSASTENPNGRMSGANPAVFREAVLAMRQAPEALRPNPEQSAGIAAILRSHQQAERAFMAKYGRELRTLNANRRGSDRPVTDRAPDATPDARPQPAQRGPEGRVQVRTRTNDRPPASREEPMEMDGPMTDRPVPNQPRTDAPPARPAASSPAAQRMQEIMALRPKAEDLERPIRALLTEPQLAWLDEKIAAVAEQQFEQRAMERYRRLAAQQIEAQGQRLDQAIAKLPPRMKSYIESLPEEDRIAALEKMRERRQNANPPDRRRGSDRAAPTSKAPPSIDEIDIPDPSGDR